MTDFEKRQSNFRAAVDFVYEEAELIGAILRAQTAEAKAELAENEEEVRVLDERIAELRRAAA